MRALLDEFIPGAPKTKGSVTAMTDVIPQVRAAISALTAGSHGQALKILHAIVSGGTKTHVRQSVTGSTKWARIMERMLASAWAGRPRREGVPIRVSLTYYLPVTQERLIEQGSGDVDKLERNVLDAITKAGVWKDDAQVVGVVHEKRCAGVIPQGVRIQIWEEPMFVRGVRVDALIIDEQLS
jgi:Holliday junction resolvase RusA-like endonuclease